MAEPVKDGIQGMYLNFLEDPTWATHVCVPAGYVEWGEPCVLEDALAKGAKRVEARLGKHAFPAYAFPLNDDKRASLQGVIDSVSPDLSMRGTIQTLPVFAASDGGPQVIPLLVPENGDVVDQRDYEPSSKSHTERMDITFRYLKPLADRVSSLANLRLRLRVDGPVQASPRRAEKGEINVFIGMAPTGEEVTREISLLHGHAIAEQHQYVTAFGPTPGRGTVFQDKRGTPSVQIIGDNWYLLAPIAAHLHKGSDKLFEDLLMEAWAAWCSLQDQPVSVCNTGKTEFIREFVELQAETPYKLEVAIEKTERLIRTGLDEITKLRRDRMHLQLCLDAYNGTGREVDQAMHIVATYNALAAQPELESFWFDEGALMVLTKRLVCTHEDQRYAIGTYVIRINQTGGVTVWCEVPARADGMPHPHMPRDMPPCFGNAGDAISEAAAEYRYYDVVRYVIEWLTAGYSPDTSLVKIEDWPLADAEGRPLTTEPDGSDLRDFFKIAEPKEEEATHAEAP